MQPAARWEDGLPTGNGQVGAMVYGAIAHDVVLVNHEALWLRRPRPKPPRCLSASRRATGIAPCGGVRTSPVLSR